MTLKETQTCKAILSIPGLVCTHLEANALTCSHTGYCNQKLTSKGMSNGLQHCGATSQIECSHLLKSTGVCTHLKYCSSKVTGT